MGEELAAETPFLFFCDFEKDLAAAVTTGRRNEFAHFARFRDPAEREPIPDPSSVTTFEASRLDWDVVVQPRYRDWLRFYRELVKLRCRHVTPRLSAACAVKSDYKVHGDRGLTVHWVFPDRSKLILLANLGTVPLSGLTPPASEIIYSSEEVSADALRRGTLPAWSVVWFLES